MMVPAASGQRFFRFFASLLIGGSILGACGIEDYPYLDPVDPGIPMRLNTTAFIRLPEISADQAKYFQNFVIYYRIYISGLPVSSSVSTDQMTQINSALATDYTYFHTYATDNTTTTTVPSTMGTMFSNRKYYPLVLEGASIESLLGSGAGGKIITLDFAANAQYKPSLIIGNADLSSNASYPQYQLFRYSETGFMRPYDNYRYFVNTDEINNAAHINATDFTNLDIQKSAQDVSGQSYTYVSMYILSYGIDNNFSNIYSTPTFIGVFLLPD